MTVGDYVTIVTKSCNSFTGSLYLIEAIEPNKFIYRELFSEYRTKPEEDTAVFNLDYKTNAPWESQATITLANDFVAKISKAITAKRVKVKPKKDATWSNNRKFENVPLVAENDTHFEVFGIHSFAQERGEVPIVLAKRDYEYSIIEENKKIYI